jgi:hypothetical protein
MDSSSVAVVILAMSQIIAAAVELIHALPTRPKVHTFYDRPDVRTPGTRRRWVSTGEQLREMSIGQPEREFTTLALWAADAFTGVGMFEEALLALPPITLGGRASYQTSKRLCLLLELSRDIGATDVLTLFGAKVTKFGKANLEAVALHIEVALCQRREFGEKALLPSWAADAHEVDAGYSLFSGHPSYLVVQPPRGLSFDRSITAEAFCVQAIRSAENAWRAEQKIPHVGEGWVAETKLYYEIKAAMPEWEVQHHATLPWLGRQHLDIFVPGLSVAVEYQGEQHDRPVEFFGGEKAFAQTVERDQRKASLCRRHGIRLLYVSDGYRLADVVLEVRQPA